MRIARALAEKGIVVLRLQEREGGYRSGSAALKLWHVEKHLNKLRSQISDQRRGLTR